MLLFAYILIISTWIFKISTFVYQVIILLKTSTEVIHENISQGIILLIIVLFLERVEELDFDYNCHLTDL